MKKMHGLSLLLGVLVPMLIGCEKEPAFEVKEIDNYFYEVGTYTSLDYKFVNEYFAKENDNWGGGCSAISSVINGERLVGRNMDLNISNKCAYVVRTKIPEKYETFGLAYTFRDISPDLEKLKKDGLGEDFEKVLPFMCDDVMNSEGLHIEINMRHAEKDTAGKDIFGVEYTNKKAAERVYVFTLGQYIALNCKDLEAAKDYLKNSIDVYSKKDYWNYCFLVTDAKGNSNLLEFGHGKYYWVEPDNKGVIAQTNFYINSECNALEDIKTGEGRYNTLMAEIGNVKNKSDLYKLMDKVSFSWYYAGFDVCKNNHFDPRSEVIGEENPYGLELTYDYVMSEENYEFISGAMDALTIDVRTLTREQKQNDNAYWESSFTEVVNPKTKTIEVRLFENSKMLYKITFENIEKIESI